MTVDLQDLDGHVSIRGFPNSSVGLDNHEAGWFDRLLCSVVQGAHEHSFAAIQYTVFRYASLATVKVHFFFKDEHSSQDSSKIHGSLIALYHNYGSKEIMRYYIIGMCFFRGLMKIL